MAFRTVRSRDAHSAEQAEGFIVSETGGQVIPTGRTEEVAGGWRVEVHSLDGRASMPFPVGAVFPNDSRMSDAEIERQVKQFGRGQTRT
jgi:hypothetical protein